MLSANKIAPTMSTGSRTDDRDSAGISSVYNRAISASGARNQNTDGQPQSWTSRPPSNGPAAEPIAYINVNIATARPRFSSGNSPVTKAGAQLTMNEAPIP